MKELSVILIAFILSGTLGGLFAIHCNAIKNMKKDKTLLILSIIIISLIICLIIGITGLYHYASLFKHSFSFLISFMGVIIGFADMSLISYNPMDD